MHETSHPMAGKTVRIKAHVTHFQNPNFGGSEYRLEDWWDTLSGVSWMEAKGNPACLVYAMRSGEAQLPADNEVVYGKVGHLGHLVHVSEIEETPEEDTTSC